jgi:LysM repeat protein
MKTRQLITYFALALMTMVSCKKDTPASPQPTSTQYVVKLTDAPGPYTAVNVDIQSVEIISSSGTQLLNVNAGIYNLLDFTNGVDTILATGSINAEQVQQIRLILGSNNSVVVAGTVFPLVTPSASQSGLKLQVHQILEAGVQYEVLLDFDANKSIVLEGNGTYSLKPVIRSIETAISGSIKGSVTPVVSGVMATLGSASASYTTYTNAQGQFLFQGLSPGAYTIGINPLAPYTATQIPNVGVTVGQTTLVGPIGI